MEMNKKILIECELRVWVHDDMVVMGNNKNERRIKIGDRKKIKQKSEFFVSLALGMRVHGGGKVKKHNI